MLSYFLRQLGTWRRLRETIRHQQETIETLEEALKQPYAISRGRHLLVDSGDSYIVYTYRSVVDKHTMRPHLGAHMTVENLHG